MVQWSSGWDFTFQCRGCGFDPWSGSWDPTCLAAKKPKHKTEEQIQLRLKKKKKKTFSQQFRTNFLVRESFRLLSCGSGRDRFINLSWHTNHQFSTKWIQGDFTHKCKGWLAGIGHSQGSYDSWASPSFMGGGGGIKTTSKREQQLWWNWGFPEPLQDMALPQSYSTNRNECALLRSS